MKFLLFFLVFATTLILLVCLWQIVTSNRRKITERLNLLSRDEKQEDNDELSKPLKERVLEPFLDKLSQYLSRLMPKTQRQTLRNKLALAGNPLNLKAHEFMALQYAAAIFFSIISGVIIWLRGMETKIVLILILAGFAGFKLPVVFLKIKSQKRQKQIARELPNIIDLLTVSMEAGLGFDAALAKVTVKAKGILSDEFRKVLHEIKMGKSRREALKDLVKRTEAEELSNFISAVLQADGLGVSMTQILRIQSEQMRRKRRQRAEEEAMKAPIKMLFPMVFFIFPCIFIVLLGPAIIKIFTQLFAN
ncbi:MAG: tight adherence protein [Clostridia bacterium]|jgi:tight adherence protein C|nr:Type secretion system domain protein [Clostridiales bacterium]MDK2985668.1 tight adherence protein [Clostridia bacterium]